MGAPAAERRAVRRHEENVRWTIYIFISASTAAALFAMNATGIGLQRSFTPYLVGTLLLFGAPVVLFIRLLHSAIGPGRAA